MNIKTYTVHDGITLAAAAVATAPTGATPALGALVQVDMERGGLGLFREFVIHVKTVTNATPPGSAKTITFVSYWSNDVVALASVNDVLIGGLKTSHTAMTLTNSASVTRYFRHHATSILRPEGRYLYIGFIKDAFDSGAEVTLTTKLVRLPTTYVNI